MDHPTAHSIPQQAVYKPPGDPPREIQQFYDKIHSLSLEEIAKLPEYICLSDSEGLVQHDLLSLDYQAAQKHQNAYHTLQETLFDIAGRCTMGCPMTQKHPHNIQAGPVLKVKDFASVTIYPRLLQPVLPEMLDEMMALYAKTDKGSRIRVRDEYAHVVRHFYSHYISPEAGFHLATQDRPSGLGNCLLPGRSRSMNTVSTVLGCDAIFVMGAKSTVQPTVPSSEDDESWKDLVSFEPESGIDAADVKVESEPKDPSPKYSLAAIHLRAGDVVTLDAPRTGNFHGWWPWFGIAKVLEQSSSVAYQFPHLRLDDRDGAGIQAIRGLLTGRALQVEFS